MDIAKVASTFKEGSLMQAVGLKMLNKSLEQQNGKGSNMAKMIEQSIQPHIGSKFDMKL
ncbi:MAG: putative motility protein [Lachnospiraceae bacterium]|nr:putative motility protein [Lachnospiraceae bacterium]